MTTSQNLKLLLTSLLARLHVIIIARLVVGITKASKIFSIVVAAVCCVVLAPAVCCIVFPAAAAFRVKIGKGDARVIIAVSPFFFFFFLGAALTFLGGARTPHFLGQSKYLWS